MYYTKAGKGRAGYRTILFHDLKIMIWIIFFAIWSDLESFEIWFEIWFYYVIWPNLEKNQIITWI